MKLPQKFGAHLLAVSVVFGSASTWFAGRAVHDVLVVNLYSATAAQNGDHLSGLAKGIAAGAEQELLRWIREVKDVSSAKEISVISSSGEILAAEDIVSRGTRLPCLGSFKGWETDGAPFVERRAGERPFLDLLIPVYGSAAEPEGGEYLFEGGEKPRPALLGALHMHLPMDAALDTERQLTRRLLIVTVGAAACGLLIGIPFLGAILAPLRRLTRAADRLRQGESGVQVPVEGRDEISELGEAFNRMSAALASTTVSMDYLTSVLDSLGSPVVVVDRDGAVLRANQALFALLGCAESDVVGRPLDRHLAMGQEEEGVLRAGGGEVPVRATVASVRQTGHAGERVIVLHDLRELRRTEEERSRTAKLESVGVMAGGIAHDFNNLLTVILGAVSLLHDSVSGDAEAREVLTSIERASRSARRLTHQLLTFAKGGMPVKEVAPLGPLLREEVGLALRGSTVKADFRIADDLRAVEIDKGQVGEVLHNLVINACQAMPEGGRLEVRARNKEGEAARVEVSMTDNGVGIPQELLGRVFDPYFSTKPKGHGLGLAVCHSVIKKHGGDISVSSRLGAGTTFVFTLPASAAPPPKAPPEAPAVPAAVAGAGRLLVMDDEETVGRMASRLAGRLGYATEWVRDGAAAVEAFRRARESGPPIQVAIFDLTVPGGMGGRQAAAQVLEFDPAAKIIVSSGYSDDPVMSEPGRFGFAGALAKPYTLAALRAALGGVRARPD